MAKNETIKGLEFLKEKLFNGIYKDRLDCIDKAIEFINKNDWIPCTVIDHPEHINACEVTIRDTYGIRREIGFYSDIWRREADETPLDVIAWKEPSQPFNPIVKQIN